MTTTVPGSRADAAALLLEVLAAACSGGDVRLIGSMATERADAFSDIDIRWTLPPGESHGQLESLRRTLQQVGAVESLRVDPTVRPNSRLAFVRFQGWPLWWRLDLEIHSVGLESMGVGGSDPWSPDESGCMGVVVTLKALARNRPDVAEDLLARARQRVNAADVVGDWQTRIDSLLDQIGTSSPPIADLVARTRLLAREVLHGQTSWTLTNQDGPGEAGRRGGRAVRG